MNGIVACFDFWLKMPMETWFLGFLIKCVNVELLVMVAVVRKLCMQNWLFLMGMALR